jgi:hypothetical protein
MAAVDRTHDSGRGPRLWIVGTFAGAVLFAAGCGYAPQPPQAPLANDAAPTKRVMLVGDSLLAQAAPMIIGELAAHHMPAVVINHSVGAWGLLTARSDANGPSTPSKPADVISSWIAQDNPDIVVVEFGGNYWPGPDGPNDYKSLAWSFRWIAEAERFTQAVLATGRQLYWVIPPPSSSIESNSYGLRDLSIIEAYSHPGVGLVDWWTPMTTNEGHWTIWINDGDGQGYFPIRNGDGVHFTTQGAQRIAEWTVMVLRPQWDVVSPPSMTTPSTTTSTSSATVPAQAP